MKRILLASFVLAASYGGYSQCTVTNATSCVCPIPNQTTCDLLPDITVSWYALQNYLSGPSEYPQVCNPPCSGNDGRLRLSASTPNIGFGPLTVMGSSYYVCGTDTFSSNPGTCPDGSTPRQLIHQRIYVKSGNTMTYYDRWAGAMTYHSSHGHNHVDDWGVFTLRIATSDPDPRNWPIVAQGAKLGFCLMDYYQCGNSSALNHCKDVNTMYGQGNTLINSNFPNFGLGGGSYNCSVVMQGISSGYTDVYDENLDLMWINIPPGTCNGQYYIVLEVDPNNNFLEADETNNYTYIPYTLSQQSAPGNAVATISYDLPSPKICPGQNITLKANAASSYLWSTGATTQTIVVNTPGVYSVNMTDFCGSAGTSITVYGTPAPVAPVAVGDTVCAPSGVATLTATGVGSLVWRDVNGNIVGTGSPFQPTITATTTYTVEDQQTFTDTSGVGPKDNTYGAGANSTSASYLSFSVFNPMKLISVRVNASANGTRLIELRDSTGAVITSTTATLVAGWNTVTLNWTINPGNAYRLLGGTGVSCYRNNNNATNFPYTLNNVVSITGSSGGPAYYYYFYDWKVETYNRYCTSPTTPVIAQLEICASITPNKDLNNTITVYPNPSSGNFNLNVALPGTAVMKIRVMDMMGKKVYDSNLNAMTGMVSTELNLSSLPRGIYTLDVNIAGKSYFRKLVIQ
jgi:hypothetical protein